VCPSDENLLLLAYASGLLILWHLEKRTVISQFFHDQGMLNTVAFSPNGDHILAGYQNGAVLRSVRDRPAQAPNLLAFAEAGHTRHPVRCCEWTTLNGKSLLLILGGNSAVDSESSSILISYARHLTQIAPPHGSSFVNCRLVYESPWPGAENPLGLVCLTNHSQLLQYTFGMRDDRLAVVSRALPAYLTSPPSPFSFVHCEFGMHGNDESLLATLRQQLTPRARTPFMLFGGGVPPSAIARKTPASQDLLITGHQGGQLLFWDLSAGEVQLLRVVNLRDVVPAHLLPTGSSLEITYLCLHAHFGQLLVQCGVSRVFLLCLGSSLAPIDAHHVELDSEATEADPQTSSVPVSCTSSTAAIADSVASSSSASLSSAAPPAQLLLSVAGSTIVSVALSSRLGRLAVGTARGCVHLLSTETGARVGASVFLDEAASSSASPASASSSSVSVTTTLPARAVRSLAFAYTMRATVDAGCATQALLIAADAHYGTLCMDAGSGLVVKKAQRLLKVAGRKPQQPLVATFYRILVPLTLRGEPCVADSFFPTNQLNPPKDPQSTRPPPPRRQHVPSAGSRSSARSPQNEEHQSQSVSSCTSESPPPPVAPYLLDTSSDLIRLYTLPSFTLVAELSLRHQPIVYATVCSLRDEHCLVTVDAEGTLAVYSLLDLAQVYEMESALLYVGLAEWESDPSQRAHPYSAASVLSSKLGVAADGRLVALPASHHFELLCGDLFSAQQRKPVQAGSIAYHRPALHDERCQLPKKPSSWGLLSSLLGPREVDHNDLFGDRGNPDSRSSSSSSSQGPSTATGDDDPRRQAALGKAQRARAGVADARRELEETREALDERGRKLSALHLKTAELADNSRSFAANAARLREKRRWF